jgi:hypothetical protein
LLAEVLPLLGSQILEPLGPATDPLLLFLGKISEVLVAFADRLFFLGRKFLPPPESFLRLFPFLRGHPLPSFRPPAKTLLPFRGQSIPLLPEDSQDLLLFRG